MSSLPCVKKKNEKKQNKKINKAQKTHTQNTEQN